MTEILIAAFDRYEDAAEAKQALLAEGLANDDVQLSASKNPDTVASSQVDVSVEGKESAAEKLGAQVGDFFNTLFGRDTDDHPDYREAIRRGSTVLTVSLPDASGIERIEQLLIDKGAIDIDERSAEWGDGSRRPETASTETLTTGYPEASSVTTGVTETDTTTAEHLKNEASGIPGQAENRTAATRKNSAGRVRLVSR
ncbi:hypothetical protein [Stutzerimonas tarimensis]|uniref:General stress protein 17M-like domain-containing protein n=1 Tax=Stutzerimonas tarimensis TaxID=1507735 RepID=A0ABV7T0N9_9GAMM